MEHNKMQPALTIDWGGMLNSKEKGVSAGSVLGGEEDGNNTLLRTALSSPVNTTRTSHHAEDPSLRWRTELERMFSPSSSEQGPVTLAIIGDRSTALPQLYYSSRVEELST